MKIDATSKMTNARLFIFSALGGVAIAIVLTVIAFSVQNRSVTRVLLWQDVMLANLVGPGAVLYTDEQGKAHYEGTPIHMLIVPVGFILSIPTYPLVTCFFLVIWGRLTNRRRTLE